MKETDARVAEFSNSNWGIITPPFSVGIRHKGFFSLPKCLIYISLKDTAAFYDEKPLGSCWDMAIKV